MEIGHNNGVKTCVKVTADCRNSYYGVVRAGCQTPDLAGLIIWTIDVIPLPDLQNDCPN